MKTCNRCRLAKPLSDFSIQREGKYSWPRGQCKRCRSDKQVERYRANRESILKDDRERRASRTEEQRRATSQRQSSYNRKWKYGLSDADFDAMLEAQHGLCVVCEGPFAPGRPNVDHDHSCCPRKARSCGKCVRGLLCHRCNRFLGWYEAHTDRINMYLGRFF